MDLRDHVRMLILHWLGVLIIVALVVAGASAYTFTRTKIYAAEATGFVNTGGSTNAALGSVGDELSKSRATSYVSIAKSRAVAQQVVDDLGLDTDPSTLVGDISVEQPLDTVLIQITARESSPEGAQELADAWVEALATQVKKLEDPNGAERVGTPRVQVYGAAALPSSPVSPKPLRNLVLALLLGLALGYGYALLRHNLDRRLRTPQVVQDRFDVAVMGSVPMAGVLGHEPGERAELALEVGDGAQRQREAAEAFRKLRTNLIFMEVDNPPRVIVVTSPQPGDGKSTVAANLAAAVAVSGQPVILVDGDLRRPTVGGSFQVDQEIGLTDVLVGRLKPWEALQPSAVSDNLQVMSAGRIPPNPSELLGSQAMKSLLAELSSKAMVIVDAPPLLPVTDAAILTAAADGALVVISAGRTLDAELSQALGHLASVNGRALGIIMNKSSRRTTGGYYYYESSYYGTDDDKKATRKRAGRRSSPKRSRGRSKA
ncbi:polysaccharide biosynthesis tyrosine autokinase [Nocardioides sp. KIGAM211]|uniref:Polysaccharide biosynthesis tyrosine autokinase n=1 Tax=Nocardioides luti TaxID=2761101 RepID=A0A7X0RHM9_9ACTN|nr:polysaccharide biosynthesis tyrosine autokinase [Nocardioides luti]MBB6628503.1 polysaccharide biosynthesis tyrosine autokinase [Nocardioides luti]